MTLDKLSIGQSARITRVGGEGALRQHFLDMGMIPGQVVTLTKYAPLGDPMELLINGYSLTLRLADAAQIDVEPVEDGAAQNAENSEDAEISIEEDAGEHPGFGEDGRFHSRKDENPLPKGTVLTFALAGNQNCGKTTLFNQLTGANQHVGNFPGVTVDRKDGVIRGHQDTLVTDLPGIYSLSPYTSEHFRGTGLPALHPGGETPGHNQHSGRRQHREEPLPYYAASGAQCPHGAGSQYDG